MPVIEKNLATRSTPEKGLYDALVAELRNPQPSGQPLVEIRQMTRGGVRHVHVIWDGWAGCRPEARRAIILDAFAATRGEEFERSIAITVAATVPEAGDAGILPFEVRPYGWDRLDVVSQEKARAAVLREGGSLLGGGPAPLLRYATSELARDGIARLREAVPALQWDVIETKYLPG